MSVGGGGGGGGGGTQNVQSTTYQTNIPDYLRPYAEQMLGQASALTDVNQNPYQSYDGQRFAGFTPMQQQAFGNVQNQTTAPQLGTATGLAQQGAQQGLAAGQNAAGLQQNALQYGGLGSLYGSLGAMTAPLAQQYGSTGASIGLQGVDAAQQGFNAGANYAQMATDPSSISAYMSPYMQNVVESQQREAARQSEVLRNRNQSQAVQQGAFGGTRSAIVEAERQRNLATQLGDIQAQGLQSAFQQAQQAQQFGANLGLQGLQAGLQGLGVGLQGQQTGLQGIQTGLQGTAQGMAGAQTGLQGVQTATGAGQYGLQGAQVGLQGAGQLGQLGDQLFNQQMSITDALQKYGALQQQQQQQQLDFDYQQWLARQQYPYQQLSFLSDILRGTPSSQSSMYTASAQAQPNLAAQLAGLGITGLGGVLRNRAGGLIRKYAGGGNVTPDAMTTMAVQELPSRLRRLSDTQLAAYARTVKDAVTLSAINAEVERRARARMPYQESPADGTPVAEQIAQRAEEASLTGAKGGGIVSLAGGGIVAPSGGSGPTGISPAGVAGVSTPAMQPNLQQLEAERDMIRQQLLRVPAREQVNNPDYEALRRRAGELLEQINRLKGPITPPSTSSIGNLREQVLQQAAARQPPSTTQPATPAAEPTTTTTEVPQAEPPKEAAQTPSEAVQAAPVTQPGQEPIGSAGASASAGAGIGVGSRSPLPPTFEAFKQMLPGTLDLPPESQALVDDMRSRVIDKMSRAERADKNALSDALIAGGLAMMSGISLADGIAKAAAAAGPAWFASKDRAEKMIDKATDADIAFRQYELALRNGERDRADAAFERYMKLAVDVYNIDQRTAATLAAASAKSGGNSGLDKTGQVLDRFQNLINEDPIVASLRGMLGDQLAPDQRDELLKALYNHSIGKARYFEQNFGVPADALVLGTVPELAGFSMGTGKFKMLGRE